jgi:hypothetical protein
MEDKASEIVKAHCNECRHITNHKVLKSRKQTGSDREQGFWWETRFDMLECCGCEEVMLRRRFVFSENEGADVSFFPPRASRWLPTWSPSLPAEIRSLLSEIYTALQADSLRLAMMGARAAIETAMIAKVGDNNSFQANLQALENAGYVSKANRKFLEVALDAGNAAMHRAHVPTAEQMDTVMDIVENLLSSLFVLEKPSAALKAATPPRARKKKKQGEVKASQ